MEFELLIDDAPIKFSLEEKGKTFVLRDGKALLEAEILRLSGNELMILAGGRMRRVYIVRDGERKIVHAEGRIYVIREPGQSAGRFAGADDRTPEGGWQVKAPMPGKVIKLSVVEGQEVRKNQTLAIVEAMKMENEIKSGREGVVKKIYVAAGDLIDAQRPLIELEPKG